jgi:hydrogenase maturation protease
MPRRAVVFAVGNESRGDDALGPLLLARLSAWQSGEGRSDFFELIDDFQLQIEHALDLTDRPLALFIDAGAATAAPYTFDALAPGASIATHSTHALPPAAVLAVFRLVARAEPPPSFVLCVRGESFELGDGLSAGAQVNLEAAWLLLRELVRQPTPSAWREHAGCAMMSPAIDSAPREEARMSG